MSREPSRHSVVACLLGIHACLVGWGATVHSPNFDEPGHLAAGLAVLHLGRFDIYPHNPPLVKVLAALPVFLTRHETAWHVENDEPTRRKELELGVAFTAANGERTFWLFTLARWACIPFGILGGFLCWKWAMELYGNASGYIALLLWVFSPNILANAQTITPDVAAATVGLFTFHRMSKWLQRNTWAATVIVGLAIGLAELTKFTWVAALALLPTLVDCPYLSHAGVVLFRKESAWKLASSYSPFLSPDWL